MTSEVTLIGGRSGTGKTSVGADLHVTGMAAHVIALANWRPTHSSPRPTSGDSAQPSALR